MNPTAPNSDSECSVLLSPRTGSSNSHHRPVQHVPELRPPPARYSAHTSNLVGFPSVPGSQPVRWTKADEGGCTHLPRHNMLLRILAAMIALLVFIQAISCGLFFCVRLPFSPRPYVDYRDLISELDMSPELTGAASASSSGISLAGLNSRSMQQLSAPKLIPRVIHQTYRSTRLPASAKQFMHSWQERNGEAWQVRLYSDEACLNFVRREFPEYFEAYMNLPKDVERADFFRYMVILRLGGVYADIDVECRQPLDSVIQPADTLLVGWDAELSDSVAAGQQQYARQRQVATWFFAAAPGHPVLRQLCDHIARNAMTVFSNNTVRDTLERTGQGIWTDLVLQHALQHPAAKHDDPWKVRILPRVAFGVHPSDDEALGPHLPGVVVLHHFLGRWQWQGTWARTVPAHRKALQVIAPLLPRGWFRRSDRAQDVADQAKASNTSHYPVSVDFYPPFTMMVDLVGSGDKQADVDVSAAVTAHGTWQPAVAPYRRPAVVEALVGALSRHSSSAAKSPVGAGAAAAPNTEAAAGASSATPTAEDGASSAAAAPAKQHHRGVLVDVGAGHGFFSLAAAARGHKVIAFETSPGSLAAFKASIAYNGFGSLIDLRSTVLGATPGKVCLQEQPISSSAGRAAAEGPALTGTSFATSHSSHTGQNTESQAANAYAPSRSRGRDGFRQAQHRLLAPDALLRRRRGYTHLTDRNDEQQDSKGCAATMLRQRLSDALANRSDVAVLRISAHGHEGFVVQGALQLLKAKDKPDVVYIEFCPAAMKAAGYQQPKQLLQQLFDLGYSDIAHAGRVCDQRWSDVTHGFRLQGTFSQSARITQQPTWCKLRPENFQLLIDRADPSVPENVLFVLGHGGNHNEGNNYQQRHSSGSSMQNITIRSGSSKTDSTASVSSRSVRGGQAEGDSTAAGSHTLATVSVRAAVPAKGSKAAVSDSAGDKAQHKTNGLARRVGGVTVAGG